MQSDLELNPEVVGQRDHSEPLARGTNHGDQLGFHAALCNCRLRLGVAPLAHLTPQKGAAGSALSTDSTTGPVGVGVDIKNVFKGLPLELHDRPGSADQIANESLQSSPGVVVRCTDERTHLVVFANHINDDV